MTSYKIIRFTFPDKKRVIKRGLSLAQAQAWCSSPDTHKVSSDGSVIWFDGYEEE